MTGVGRQILYRISIRCAVEWGAALARLEQSDCYGFANQPYEAAAWHDALYIVDALYHGWPIDERFLNARIFHSGKGFKNEVSRT